MRKNLLVLSLIVLFTFGCSLYALPSTAHAAAIPGYTSGAAPHALHPNINQVACNGRTDFTRVYNTGGGETCYASAGYTGAYLPNTTDLYAGNNYGWVQCYSGVNAWPCYSGTRVYFGIGGYWHFGPPVLITQICLGPNC